MATKQFSQLSTIQKDIFNYVSGKRIKELDFSEVVKQMSLLIIEVHAKCGQKITPNNTIEEQDLHNSTVISFCEDLIKYNGTLTLDEIRYCFNEGYKREFINGAYFYKYGEYFGLNNKTYFQWINGYTFCEDRVKALKAITEAVKFIENPPVPPPTPEEIAEISRKVAITAWKDSKAGKEILDIGNAIYNYIDGLKMIPFSKERKNEILKQSQDELIGEKKDELNKVTIGDEGKPQYDKINAKSIKGLIDDLRLGEPYQTENGETKYKPHPLVISRTKRNALNIYFEELAEMGADFEFLLNKKLSECTVNQTKA